MDNQIEIIKNLEDDWNGYGAEKIKPEIIETAEKIVNLLKNVDSINVFPTAAESIQIELEDENIYLEIVVEEKDQINIYTEVKQ